MARYNFISNDDMELVTGPKAPAPEVPNFRGEDLKELARRYAAYRELNPPIITPFPKPAVLADDDDFGDSPQLGWLDRIFSRLANLGQAASQ